jgi:hypothetical protein
MSTRCFSQNKSVGNTPRREGEKALEENLSDFGENEVLSVAYMNHSSFAPVCR